MPASIEILAKSLPNDTELLALVPKGTLVYLPDIGGTRGFDETLVAAVRLNTLGYIAVPHIAARRIESLDQLIDRIAAYSEQAAVTQFLVIAGGLARPAGPLSSTMDLLNTGVFTRYGTKKLAIAGHPAGSPDFPPKIGFAALWEKQEIARELGIEMRIVTQFGFAPGQTLAWLRALPEHSINLPIHLGIAGPASIARLIKYAQLCGVENSLAMLRKAGSSVVNLAAGYKADALIDALTVGRANRTPAKIEQLHIFPFGGLKPASSWLKVRGSWSSEY